MSVRCRSRTAQTTFDKNILDDVLRGGAPREGSYGSDDTSQSAGFGGVHVGMISTPRTTGAADRAGLVCPAGGELRVATERTHARGACLHTRVDSAFACRQNPPYRYVSVEGPITAIDSVDAERDLPRPAAISARRAIASSSGHEALADSILIRMRPERWLTADYAKENL
jgi:hypothetical protein